MNFNFLRATFVGAAILATASGAVGAKEHIYGYNGERLDLPTRKQAPAVRVLIDEPTQQECPVTLGVLALVSNGILGTNLPFADDRNCPGGTTAVGGGGNPSPAPAPAPSKGHPGCGCPGTGHNGGPNGGGHHGGGHASTEPTRRIVVAQGPNFLAYIPA